MRILKYTLVFLLLLLVAFAGGIWYYKHKHRPRYEGEVAIEGLHAPVQVWFDTLGIPHIEAASMHDAYLALGYVHAQDRLFQMEMIRRLTSGRLAEVLGPPLLESDKFFRTFGIRHMAEQTAAEVFADERHPMVRAAQAYLSGINAFIAEGRLPPEFDLLRYTPEPFEPADIYTAIGYMCLGFAPNWAQEPVLSALRDSLGEAFFEGWAFYDALQQSDAAPAPPLEGAIGATLERHLEAAGLPLWTGSNAWVIGPEKSGSGKPLLANDTHIKFGQPAVWYEAHIEYPGFRFTGHYLAGVPFGVVGHNDSLGWGLTIFPFDNMDLFAERLHPESADSALYRGAWYPLQRRVETIEVKGGQPVALTVRTSRHGPLIGEVVPALKGQAVALWWPLVLYPTRMLEVVWALNQAQNMAQVVAAAEKVDWLGLNLVYADARGNYAWWGTGKIPIRPPHVQPAFVLDGASGHDDPLGFQPFADNPHLVNPPEGFIASANQDPRWVRSEWQVAGLYTPPDRYLRLHELLSRQDMWTPRHCMQLQLETTSALQAERAHHWARLLDLEGAPYARLRDTLASWPGNYPLRGAAPVLFTKVQHEILKRALADEMGVWFDELVHTYPMKSSFHSLLMNAQAPWWDDRTTPLVETQAQIVQAAFRAAVDSLVAQLGPDPSSWHWGQVHTLTHVHPIGRQPPFDKLFNVGPFAVAGGNDVPLKMEYRVSEAGIYPVASGPALRVVVDFADPTHWWNSLPTGQSGNVFSPHYADQAAAFAHGRHGRRTMVLDEVRQRGTLLLLSPPPEGE